VRPDGTGITNLTGGDSRDFSPSWSPGGDKILFNWGAGPGCLSTMNPDGRGYTTLWDRCTFGPGAWSPDGSKIAFAGIDSSCSCSAVEIYVMNADGSNRTNITNTPDVWEGNPDWQPTQPHFLPRPKGATPFQTYLTVAYTACPLSRVNRSHGLPLGVQSCNPPMQSSDYLTVGTLDANGQPAKAVGSVRYDVRPGNPSTPADEADVKLAVSIKDVREKSDLSDYPGELQATSTRRITDKDNTPDQIWGNTAATTQDFPFSATVPCASTPDTTIGSTCDLFTTADALIPGQVKEGKRANWQLAQVQVYDGGADADADTPADNTLFMDEGIFVP
jgi:WD40-like Beta Propeller Repeat